ncbi:uncharacterized protein E0L32_012397 [Thyridium curvatum]|uniref:Uncharacterized protein n=1 Tax=Thyridium curvatum TaxID=1093900 RepID=A0A507BJC2_9PEZI|nr:uncharacterized protein E0L32_012397 [Thyridium curvatum]TPX16768.1 hypothetical protein E0L32_012397 [Thyridium curvatum]
MGATYKPHLHIPQLLSGPPDERITIQCLDDANDPPREPRPPLYSPLLLRLLLVRVEPRPANMQAVPSLVGTGTVVAAAAAGLVFAQPADSTPSRPTSNKRKLTSDYDVHHTLPTSSRPGTSATNRAIPDQDAFSRPQQTSQAQSSVTTKGTRRARSATTQITPPKGTSRRQSFVRQGEWAPPPIAEHSRDSISSNGSWMRRLSIRPLSQHGSIRSSIGPDSPSITFSHGSGAPILPGFSVPPQVSRNKLVKRTTQGQESGNDTLARRGSRSQMPTLRRPATSHQRSATLQRNHVPEMGAGQVSSPKYSLDQQAGLDSTRMEVDPAEARREAPHPTWTSFFHSRIMKSAGRNSSRSHEGSPNTSALPPRRLLLRRGSMPRAFLVEAGMLSSSVPSGEVPGTDASLQDGSADPAANAEDETPSKRARRSISMHFSAPSTWISRTGSIRRPKRGADGESGGKRHVSDPVRTAPGREQQDLRVAVRDIFTPPDQIQNSDALAVSNSEGRPRPRDTSSPIPPLSRLSSFNVDLSRLGASSSAGQRAFQLQGGTLQPSQTYAFHPRSREVSNERASTLTGSDLEMRGFASGDDDDTDFKSDTMFDSVRTAGSNRLRSVETPLDSMFDESPPSTAGNGKTKRLSIQEILGRSWDGDTKIMEEDEGVPTPVRGGQSAHTNRQFPLVPRLSHGPNNDVDMERPSADLSITNRDFSRLSLDDDDDDDWARDEEDGVSNNLSPPTSSINSRRVSPNLRMALANISGNVGADTLGDPAERPRSNVFDWSEPSQPEKNEMSGHSPRPKTVHGKQELDLRGGRASNRKGPVAAHIRSQSVPVIPDISEIPKSASKFGTWASGPKNASEDWDDDFEFEVDSGSDAPGRDSATSFSMVVPASIQATQPTVKAHSGQIRELSLLVDGLKRLCRHGRDLNLLEDAPSLWKEAENIIALASPDEDSDAEETRDEDRKSDSFDPSTVDERFLEEGFDAKTLDSFDDPFERPDPDMAKTAVVRERHVVRRRSVFSPDDDIFGSNWPLTSEENKPVERPHTPDQPRRSNSPDNGMITSIMEAMQQQRSSSAPIRSSPMKPSNSELFFNTNTLQELVKRANSLFHTLSDMVRRAEVLTQSPACTPRHEKHLRSDGSPAFTRVFTDPAASPSKRLPKSQSTNSALSRASIDSPASNGIGQRMQMMTVN